MNIGNLALLVGTWTPTQLHCPVGLLIGAHCPGQPPDAVLASFRAKEIDYASGLPPARRREWFAGRLCLRAGLELCSTAHADLLPLPSGAPYVPPGVAGSISHKKSLAIALVAPGQTACGVDIEEIEERDEALVRRVMTPRERLLGASAATATLHFSAKEAIYKLLPADKQPDIDFEDIELVRIEEIDGWTEFDGIVAKALEVCVYVYVTEHWTLTVATRLRCRSVEQT